eukprot:CAMPEP_0181224680 /NCGR_PEP_ID=MMETSP1096-20121128/31261_1 /TAXON_ID=156174 ORGANISM="Chrysochromulina ericina, Strain CCMP281" /NCGR_SAMPLE_ID=MMETSP1096 /ASSEMBLY_ACC=CAM_ASM_000453 /LENGTH=92 /DNA_ID=CAMNT_0023317789 /DNA_START=96 /DNA_END=374 /DNA_ORIENTATION=-
MSTPTGPEWEAAQPGFQTFLDEAATVGSAAGKGCCNCYDVMKMKAELDKEWTAKANEYLKAHGLILEVHAFYTSDGKSSHPHLVLQFKKLIS